MRTYDELMGRRDALRQQRGDIEERLEGVGPESDPRTYDIKVAYDSLALYILDKKLSEIDSKESLLAYELSGNHILYAGGLIDRKVKIESTSSEQDEISKFYDDGFGHFVEYAGKQVSSQSGRVKNLSLDLNTGGFIHIRKHGAIYQAAPLIDRSQDYTPPFKVTLL
jgi:hypothetical protein